MQPAQAADRNAIDPGLRLPTQPSKLALLVDAIAPWNAAARWDLSNIALDAMLTVYGEELQASTQERTSTQKRRAKLSRWQRATADLIRRLEQARNQLLDQVDFQIFTDRQHQVLIVIGPQTLAISGFNAKSEKQIENRVIADYCVFNDCSALANESSGQTDRVMSHDGVWQMAQDTRPGFQIGHSLRCDFDALRGRVDKANACVTLSAEISAVSEALQLARRQGYRIDWQVIHARPSDIANETLLMLNTQGDYLQLPYPLLQRLTEDDWLNLVSWMQKPDPENLLIIRQADRLLW